MWLRASRDLATELPFDMEHVPGLGVVKKLDKERRWHLAGVYAARHQLVGPWLRRSCATCGTRGRCEYHRWAEACGTRAARSPSSARLRCKRRTAARWSSAGSWRRCSGDLICPIR